MPLKSGCCLANKHLEILTLSHLVIILNPCMSCLEEGDQKVRLTEGEDHIFLVNMLWGLSRNLVIDVLDVT